MNNNEFNPFFIYTDKNNLYIKGINKSSEKLCNNVHFYSANLDNNNKINICCIDKNNKLIHISKNNNTWKRKTVLFLPKTYRNIQDIKLHVINNKFNLFITQRSPLKDRVYRLSHISFDNSYHEVSAYKIDNIIKNKDSIYKLNIDDIDETITLSYNFKSYSDRSSSSKTISFDYISNSWLPVENLSDEKSMHNDILEFCYGLSYKK